MIAFDALKIDALLVSALPNIRYLTGFTGSNALLVLAPDWRLLFTDPRYTVQASQETNLPVRTAKGQLLETVAAVISRKRLKNIGFEKSRIPFETWAALKEALPLGTALVPVGPEVERLRMIKSADETHRIRQSVRTNSEAFDAAIRRIRPGISENDIAAEIEYQMRRRGAEKPAFDTIVAAGVRTALPHAQPTGNKLGNNELLLIDMGATRNGYASDMTRMLFLGKPDKRVLRQYDAVLRAQLAAVAAVRPGALASAVDAQARRILKAEGLEKAFVHSTGHGLGLEIHEPPRLGKKDKTRLEAGMTVTIEPGVYIEGSGGIRIEDTVLVTNTGCEVLTPTSKELILL